jgi:hypothetical protein
MHARHSELIIKYCLIAVIGVAVALPSALAQTRKPKAKEPVESPFSIAMHRQLEREFENLLIKQDWKAAVAAFESCFDQVVACGDFADKTL